MDFINKNRTAISIRHVLKLLSPAILVLLFLSVGNIFAGTAPADFTGYAEVGSTAEKYGEFRFKINWKPEMGYFLMLADKEKKNQCFIQFKNNTDGIRIQGTNPPANPGVVVKLVNPLPDKPMAELEFNVKLHQHSWIIYLDNKEIYRLRPPFTADSLWFQNQALDDKTKKLRFQKTAPLYFHDDFMIADKDENQLDSWETLSGKWLIHTALESAIEQKTSTNLKAKPLEMERSPNFYSLKGTGENGLIVSGYPFHDNYLLQAAIQIQKGESGLAFYVQDESNFYTFTIFLSDNEDAFALLKKHQSGKPPVIMKAVQLQLLPEQWIMPKIQAMDNHISAYIDNVKVMEIDESLPPGGQFGLFVNSPQTMIFDDFTAESLPYLKLDDLQDVKFNTSFSQGDVFYKPGYFDWLFGKGKEKELFPGKTNEDRWLVFGNPEDKTAVAGASMKITSDNAAAGLLFGWKGRENPFFRLLYSQSGSKCYVRLEQLKMDGAEPRILETAELDVNEKSMLSLKAELSPDGLIKLSCNDQLVMLRQESEAAAGAAGVFVGKGSGVSVNKLVYRFKPEEVFRDKLQKNEIYANDPFMKHWANPAGEWTKDAKEQKFWHKSDFFGTFSLTVPIAENSEMHLGAKDEQASGEVIVKINGPDFEITESSGKSLFKKPTTELFKKDKDGKPGTKYELSVEDTWLWGSCNGSLAFKVKLGRPLVGTRIFIKGFTEAHMGTMHATRDNVLDFLFTEAPYEWLRNGGDWQVINRFQCDPRWSHMNGQSANDLASLWSKYQVEGDFCIEMYAGMRHGDWYQRVGDLNLTVMNRKAIPSDGYTFICSGWDPNFSQTKSRLLRNGKMAAESDKYLSPRLRDGNVRRYLDPLIGTGRDVHGAWYYVKARRIGNLVEYYFDNEKVFSYYDNDPLGKGGFGIWTFMNSMMVARVKIAAAGNITPKDFSFAEINPDIIKVEKTKTVEKPTLLLNGLPANLMTSDSWKQIDSAGAPKVTFSQNAFKVKNILGGGIFAAEAKNLLYPEDSISAWTCEIKRTENAEFNFHFELGRRNAKGEFSTLQRYFYQITGSDYSKGIFQLAGSAGELRPVKLQQLDSNENWTRVWFPVPYIFPKFGAGKDLVWKVIGFGNYQPSDIVQGLKGNGPDEAYAVRNFSPVFSQIPKVECKSQDQSGYSYQLLLDGTEIKAGNLEEFNKSLKGIQRQGLVSGKLSIAGKSDQADMMWAMPEDESRWLCKWDDEKKNSVIITTDVNYRFLNNDRLIVKVQGVELPVEELGINKFRISLLDKMDEGFRKLLQDEVLGLEITKGGKSRNITLSWKDCTAVAPPILAKLDGITPFFQSFENPELRNRVRLDSNRMTYAWDKDRNNTCLVVANKLAHQRLRIDFNANLSIAQYPLLQFMYKTDPMGQISLNLRDNAVAYLNEPHMAARKVRFGTELVKDGEWHSWTGFSTDAFDKHAYSSSIFKPSRIALGSFDKEDQTGRNSQLFLDDVVCGPAVRQAEQLAFTPYYFDRKDGVRVYTAIIAGEKPYLSLDADARKKIIWKEISNNVKFVPDLGNTAEGVHQLLLKATGHDGRESQVTSIPFLYDRTPKTANFAFKTIEDPAFNGSYLQIEWQNKNGAPLNIDSMTTAFAGTKIAIDTQLSKMEHRQDAEIFNINWPYMLRAPIDKMKNGETGELLVSGLEDGAGNKTADLHIPIKINYAEDKLPPTPLKPSLSDSILFHLDPSCEIYDKLPVNMQNVKNKTHKEGSCAFVRFSGTNGAGTLTVISRKRKNSNDIDFDSYLAMRLRFPHAEIPKTASLMLEIKYSENKTVQVGLLDGKIADDGKIDKFLDVKNNGWQDFVIDLQDLHVRKFGEKLDRRKVRIREVNLIARDLNSKDLFDLGLLTIFKESRSDEKFELDAYDQSGIADMSWEVEDSGGKFVGNGVCDGRAFALNEIVPAEGVQWLKLYFSDKAGNRTLPMVFPLIFKGTPEAMQNQGKK
ncbi:MAG TPA: hypothetical protein DCZ94_04850 [Lentisphaeria bacterium]|nr:MAG: hypothetical protein A2X48_07955 [Lentisphaerae bacterium GWF2_49_21]HBC86265.1 hypothetical protein [Lentisphaeria bacterium]